MLIRLMTVCLISVRQLFPRANPQGKGGGNMPRRIREGETCPAVLGRGEHALGGCLGQVIGKQLRLIRQTDIRQNDSRKLTIRQTDIVDETVLDEQS